VTSFPTTHYGVPLEFAIFAAMLAGVALFHRRAFSIALTGLVAVLLFQGTVGAFPAGEGLGALAAHAAHEWVILANLMLLLVGFELLSNQFEQSNLPGHMPGLLPDNWTGGVALLAVVFGLSAFLDNIAAAVIGGVMARHVYRGRVGVGFLAAIVASANAGGAGSVIGDTTTTMMWLNGVSPLTVLAAYVPAGVAFAVVAVFAARAQQRLQPIQVDGEPGPPLVWRRVVIVAVILGAAIAANITANRLDNPPSDAPWLGLAVWAAILATAPFARPDWALIRPAAKGALFLVSLVATASLMPVDALPPPSWVSTLGLGFLSAVFDNIPLTALALEQGGYDWAFLAYAVGFGGSMIWFGSSAGVALTTIYPQGRSVVAWVRQGWFVPVGYVAGYAVAMLILGWRPV
jgi:Na+/H+ antiporter NhaD/arsenite permease-like protein